MEINLEEYINNIKNELDDVNINAQRRRHLESYLKELETHQESNLDNKDISEEK